MEQDGSASQLIKGSENWRLSNITETPYTYDSADFQEWILDLISEPFDLSRDYMLRAHLIRLGSNDHLLVVTMHHIASDGWSSSIIIKEVAELYASYVAKKEPALLPLPVQYADYAVWQRNFLQGEVLNKKIDYWWNQLAGVTTLQLPLDFKRPVVWSSRGSSKSS